MLAAFSHPNIATIYGIESVAGQDALVMELVEGDTLAARLEHGPLTSPRRWPIARQIADALDAAHEKGIVHRDLKPANIKITPDGVVKVLDFGLAKAAAGDASLGLTSGGPTVTVGGDRAGHDRRDAAYMSPEQARGQAVDKRTDIWAFGCVLFEMLAGRPLFGRATLSDTLVAVLEREPEWSALPAETPPDQSCVSCTGASRRTGGSARVTLVTCARSSKRLRALARLARPLRLRSPAAPRCGCQSGPSSLSPSRSSPAPRRSSGARRRRQTTALRPSAWPHRCLRQHG